MLKSQDYVHYYRCRLTTSSGGAQVTFLQIEWGGRMMREKSGNSSSFATARAQKTFEDFKKEWGGMREQGLKSKEILESYNIGLLCRFLTDSYFIHKLKKKD